MKYAALIAALTFATPALAQDRMTIEQCTAAQTFVLDFAEVTDFTGDVSVDNKGWCLIENGRLPMGSFQTWHLNSLSWRASDIDRLLNEGLPPRSLELIALGARPVPRSGDAVLDYLVGLQTDIDQTGFGFNVRWDGVQNALVVEDAYFQFDRTNRIDATAQIKNVDLTDAASMQTSIGAMGLSDLMVTTTFDGWFEWTVAPPVGMALLDDEGVDPEAQVEALKGQAIEFISEIPDGIVPDVSREALSAFVADLPQPRGTARLQLSADPVIGAARMMPLTLMADNATPADIMSLALEGVSLLFTWSPAGENE